MAEKRVTNDQIIIMIQGLEKKMDENAIVLKDIAEDVRNVTKTVAVHEHRISSIEKKQDESRGDNKWIISTLIAVGLLTLHFIKIFSTMRLHSESLSKGGRPKPKDEADEGEGDAGD